MPIVAAQIDLTTAFQNVSALESSRQVYLLPGNATPAANGQPFVIAIEVGESGADTLVVELDRLTGDEPRYVSLPTDSSKFMRYTVVSGAAGTSTKVWMTGQETIG